MATWASNISTNLKLYLEITQVSQDINANTSQVRIRGYVSGTGNGAWSAAATSGSVILNGVTYPFTLSSYDFSGSVSVVLKDVTATIAHDSAGAKTVAGSVYWNPDNPEWLDAKTVSGSLTLTTIPRASKFTASSVDAGAGSIPITLTKSPAATTHRIKVMFGSTQIAEKDVGATPSSVAITTAEWTTFYNLTTTVTTGTLSLTLTTYNGSTVLGTDSSSSVVTYPSTDIPTCSGLSLTETNTIVQTVLGAGNYLQDLSKLRATVATATGVKGSTISEYEINVGSTTYTLNNQIFTPTTVSAHAVSARVKDSRGRWSSTITIASFTPKAYTYPKITTFDVKRATSGGVIDILGTYARMAIVASVQSVVVGTEKNKITYKVDDITGTTVNKLNQAPVAVSVNTAHTVGTYAISAVALFKLRVTDAFGQFVEKNYTLSTAEVPASFGKTGMAIGGVFNTAGATAQIYGSLMATGYANFKEWVRFEKYVQFDLSTLFTGVATFNSVPNFNAGTPVVEIPGNANLNSYTKPGEYFCPSNATTQTIANTPTNESFFLKVGKHAGIYQEFTEYLDNNPRKWFRNNYNGTWGPWYEIVYPVAKSGDMNTGYVKYSDRRMEQWKTLSVPNITFTTALGAMYYAGYKSMGNFLLAFATYNSTCSLEMECSQPDVFCVHGGMSNSSSAGNIYPFSARNAPASVFKVRIRAWGTW